MQNSQRCIIIKFPCKKVYPRKRVTVGYKTRPTGPKTRSQAIARNKHQRSKFWVENRDFPQTIFEIFNRNFGRKLVVINKILVRNVKSAQKSMFWLKIENLAKQNKIHFKMIEILVEKD